LWINENVPYWKTVWVGPTNKSALKVILEENEGYPLPLHPHPMHECQKKGLAKRAIRKRTKTNGLFFAKKEGQFVSA